MRYASLCFAVLIAVGCGSSDEHVDDLASPIEDLTAAPPDLTTRLDLLPIDYDGGLPSAANIVPLVVDAQFDNSFNYSYITITVCAPGTSTCQTIDHVWLDTGSVGLRLPSNTLNATMLAALPTEQVNSGQSLAECYFFGGGNVFGSVRTADVFVSGEVASALPVQVTGDLTGMPASCDNGQESWNKAGDLPGNAIMGIAPLNPDCVGECTADQTYFACQSGSCTGYSAATSQQLQNPIAAFATDNNGYIVQMPAISDLEGAVSPTGTLTFGIGTRSNNALTAATVYEANVEYYTAIKVTVGGAGYDQSFFDNGTDDFAFDTSAYPKCAGESYFYCPTSTQSVTATLEGKDGVTGSLPFEIANANKLFDALPADATAADDLAGDVMQEGVFIIGAPVFFGRKIFFGIQGQTVGTHQTPFFAL